MKNRHLAAVAVGVVACLLPRQARAADSWVEVKSPHFTVVSNAGERAARSVASDWEQLRVAIHTACDMFTRAPLSVERGYKPGRFSFNVKGGRCEECQGEGAITTQLYFMPDVEVTCGACKGARFNSETLEVTLRGKTIDDILNMSVEEGVTFFAAEPSIGRKIQVLADLGLGYLTLGQSATTLRRRGAADQDRAAELTSFSIGA